jgi:hypothetical protein
MTRKIVVVHKHQSSVSTVWRGIGWLLAALFALALVIALAMIVVPALIGTGLGYYATRYSAGNRVRGMFIGGSVGLVVGVLVLSWWTRSADEEPSAAAAPTTPVALATSGTRTQAAAPSQAPAPTFATQAPGVAQVPSTTVTPPPATMPPTLESWTMPDLVGENLQDAQDEIQALTDWDIFFTTSHDASGLDRMQMLDSGWQVCDQNVAPGTPITADSDIDFGVVRVEETCP